MAYQVVSIVGAVLILAAYAAQQLKKLEAETVAYQVLNCIGGALLCIAAIATKQIGFIVLEGTWAVIAAVALVRLARR